MPLISIFALLFLLIAPVEQDSASSSASLKLMTFNIRMDTAADDEDAWPYRKQLVADVIIQRAPHVVGMQEALHHQYAWLQENLNGYASIGAGRDDGKTGGEYSPLFYDSERLKTVQSGTFWLSKTPEVPGSKDWDASVTRICTWAVFTDKQTGKTFAVFNTHYDHRGETARLESSRLLATKIRSIAGTLPVVIMGDFNATPESAPVQTLRDAGYTAGYSLTLNGCEGPEWTFNGFERAGSSGNIIDYVFFSDDWKCHKYEHVTDKKNDRWPSDHLPVMAQAEF